jgi:hypothetical protein
MSRNLQLSRVTVTQEWTAEAEALVWAPDKHTAEELAEDAVDFEPLDPEPVGSPVGRAKPEPLDDGVADRMDDDDLWLILADGTVCDNDRAGLEQFRSLLTPERLEALRLARIEAGNGQLTLLEVPA